MANPQLTTESRKIFGRKVKTLRQQDLLPATVYGKELKSESLVMEQKSFNSIYDQVGETGLIDLNIKGEKKTRQVLVHNLQRHPVTNQPLHVEFHQVDLTKKVTVNIPVEIMGEAPAVGKGGVLVTLLNEVEVEALPSDLPEKFEVDISGLKELGQSILVKDLKYDAKKIKILIEDLESPVVQVEEPAKEKEPEVPVAVEGEEAAAAVETKEGEEKKEAPEDKSDTTKASEDKKAAGQPAAKQEAKPAKENKGKQEKGKEGKK